MKRRFPLQIHISTIFLVLLLLVGGILGGIGYGLARQILGETAHDLTHRIHREILGNFSSLVAPAGVAVRLLGRDNLVDEPGFEHKQRGLPFMQALLDSSPAMTSIYIGYADGGFFMLRRLSDNEDRGIFQAPPGTRYVVQQIGRSGDHGVGRYLYLDAGLQQIGEEPLSDSASRYDPRQRGWFRQAASSAEQIVTEPYLFFSTGRTGLTVARQSMTPGVVAGADIRLETLNKLLSSQRVTAGSRLAVVDAAGRVVATDHDIALPPTNGVANEKVELPTLEAANFPVVRSLRSSLSRAPGDQEVASVRDDHGRKWHTAVRPLVIEGGTPLFFVAAIPDDELMAEAERLLRYLALAMGLVVLLAVPLIFMLARRLSRDLMQLAGEAEAMRRFEFAQPIGLDSMVLEVSQLATAMDLMKRTIQRFMDISLAVASEKNFNSLLPRLLGETISAAEAQAGVLYLMEDDKLAVAARQGPDGEWPGIPLPPFAPHDAGPLLGKALASGQVERALLGEQDRHALGLDGWPSGVIGPQGIAFPLKNRQDVMLGAIVLFRREETDLARLRFVEALAGNSAVSVESRGLIHAQKALFQAFIQLIASAIDAKSPYTGGHCARVPELAKMLAEAACAQTSGPFRDFSLDEDGWEAMHVAAWLHDCGKVTTPEYVVDKATKLETLCDRIHEIRTRFEVLKRDAEIAMLRAVAAGEAETAAQARLEAEWRALDDDFAFVASCNEGGEVMAPEKLERLRQIARRTWLRTLDDSIGISHEEKARRAGQPAATLPVVEQLIADKPEHCLPRRPDDRLPPDNPLGIRMPAPELLYNRGELYNLSVARGTLSEEERFKINDHIVQTLIMLDQLPYPRHLRTVPEIAGGHHEKMDGSGYPRRLQREQMSPQARMLAIADIFEALTAVDRPYKQGKKLSEAIRIMATMKREQHIDPDLFDLFLSTGVFRRYAEKHMRPEQIDAVDIAPYLG